MQNALQPFFNLLVSTLSWVIPFVVVVSILRSPWAKGHIGEWFVRFMLRWRLDKAVYFPLHNVTLATPDGSTQIDHVIVSRFGIFAIETKNMQGWIFGSERQAEWTQKIYKRTFKFQNPLRQNYKHAKALEATLQVPPETVHSVIVFVGGSTFKTEMPTSVTYGGGCVNYILSFTQPVFDTRQVQRLVQQLRTGRLAPTRATHVAHVQQLKERHAPNTERKCPQCGSTMALRTAKSGANAGKQFWGCSTFPKCRVMQKI
ncbi:MAG: NERD domain-containing protein [Acidovorax soli]|uniref:nuclease-related domain-containing protein n=1 Tax=Acidovorax soli TaxID=592050 RepID=UPI0026F1764F|nr:NERD domain-containing protein [Acidovorax soli]MCM2345548.1 NERD domain-containing protein [Acidovorax soli]